MATWSDYKNHVRETNPEIAKDIDEVEALSQIVGAMIEQRHNLDLSQRDLSQFFNLSRNSGKINFSSASRLWLADSFSFRHNLNK